MKVRVTASALGDVYRQAKEEARKSPEYLEAEGKLKKAESELSTVMDRYQREAQRIAQEGSSYDPRIRSRLKELRREAMEALRPVEEKVKKIRADMESLEGILVRKTLTEKVAGEREQIQRMVNEFHVTEPQEEPLPFTGKIGRSVILSLTFDADKNIYKEIKRRLEKGTFKRLEAFVYEV